MRRAEAEATYDDDDETHQNQGVHHHHHAIINPEFCVPRPLNLTIIKKVMTLSRGNFTVIDSHQGTTLFKVRGPFPSYRGRRVIYNTAAAGSPPILTLRQKVLSQHTRWKVFRGESTEEEDLIFSTKQQSSWFFQRSKKLDVFLAGNTREEVCDFKLEASRNDKSCSIYAGSSSSNSLLGQMQKKHGLRTILDTQDEFFVTVAPYMDYAFVVALIIILDEMHGDQLASSQMN